MTKHLTSLVALALALGGCAAEPGDPITPDGVSKPEPLLGATCTLDSQCDAGEECIRPVCITTPCDFPGTCQLKTNYQDETLVSIPDNNATGITRVIDVPAHGRTVESLSVLVNIAHTYRGDLRVTLTSPSGTTRVLHDRTGGAARDLIIDLAGDTGFAGEPATGRWTLKVSDHAARDIGTLRHWRLVFGFGGADNPTVDAWAEYALPTPVESAHPYTNSLTRVFDLSTQPGIPGSKRVRLHFSRISTERNYDYVEILGAGDRVVQRLTGNLGAVVSDVIEGDQVKVRLRTDSSVTDWGFAIDRVAVFGHGCLDLDDCSEGYRCLLSRRVCFAYPCFQECVPIEEEPPACHVAGCSGQACSEDPGVITTCEVAPWHECLRITTCGRQPDGQCGWTETPEFLACMASHGRGAAEGEACSTTRPCNSGLYCDRDGGAEAGICRATGACEDVADCSDDGNAWPHILCVGSPTCEAGRCGWRCGPPPACRPGEEMFDGCNNCVCTDTGVWSCTRRACPEVVGLGEACGGLLHRTCAEFLACDYGRMALPEGLDRACDIADRAGTCVEARASSCIPRGFPMCGCNGQTFASDCARQTVASFAYEGRCRFGQRIPDNSATGITTSIDAVSRTAGGPRARVEVEITHTYRGDLVVTVETPGGRVLTLTNRAGGSADNFVFSGELEAPETAIGTWTLRVTDRAAVDVGTLDFFNVTPL